MNCISAFLLFIINVIVVFSNDELDFEIYPNYGTDWLYFPDGNGQLQLVFLGPLQRPDHLEIANDFFADDITHRFLETDIDSNVVFFTLYTREDPKIGEVITPDHSSITSSNFKSTRPTKFLIHGWQASGSTKSCQGIKDEYLISDDYNVFVVDWSFIASNFYYPTPMASTKSIAVYYAKFVDMLIEGHGADPKDIHLIGHSLGAHISGFTGDAVKHGKLGRVTGLDPALPGFQFGVFTGGRLSTSAADFVDVIHTCAGGLGLVDAIGHADFYPNGGSYSQPGCGDFKAIMEGCSHGRSWEFYLESINVKKPFLAYKCATFTDYLSSHCEDDGVVMGAHIPHTARGSYYLRTDPAAPFSRADQMIMRPRNL